MSSRSSIGGFNVQDFISRIIPGLVIATPVWISLLVQNVGLPKLGTGNALVLFGLSGLILGELIELVRASIFPVPIPFRQVLYHHTEDEQILSYADRIDIRVQRKIREIKRSRPGISQLVPTRLSRYVLENEAGRRTMFYSTNRSFQDEFENQFELQFSENTSYVLYSAFLSYMESRMSNKTQRLHTLQAFAQNLMFASLISMVLAGWFVIQSPNQSSTLLIGVLSIGFLLVLVYIGMFVSSSAYPYVDHLIIDYYVDRMTSQ